MLDTITRPFVLSSDPIDDATMTAIRRAATLVWSVQDIITLVTCARAGMSSSEAARQYTPHRTRNEVVGKATRMSRLFGLHVQFKAGRPEIKPLAATPTPEDVSRETVAVPIQHVQKPKTLLELTSRCCRFPLGDDLPSSKQFRFCGNTKITGMPYCTDHAKVAYTTPTENQTRDNLTC